MFDTERFIEDCLAAYRGSGPQLAVKEVVERATSDPAAIAQRLGPFDTGGIQTLHHTTELTILNIVWPSYMSLFPHNHNMWATIGIYQGQEDNTFYRRSKSGVGLEHANGLSLTAGDAIVLGADVIHAVTNPARAYTAALHIYAGDFFEAPRSKWGSVDAPEETHKMEDTMQAFAEAEEAARELSDEGEPASS